jgi:o-succinylbenzoate synthase
MQLHWEKHTLQFIKPAKTSRGEYTQKDHFLVLLSHNGITGCGEAAPLPDLSIDGQAQLEDVLTQLQYFAAENHPISEWLRLTDEFPSLQLALESAFLDLQNGGNGILFPGPFTEGNESIPFNGLVWMNTIEAMWEEAQVKIAQGFTCLKFKVGAIDTDSECRLLEKVRKLKNAFHLTIRLDANGAWSADEPLRHLKEFARFEAHSIEQPIKAGQPEAMQEVCAKSPIPVALDEELIGVEQNNATSLIKTINPAYLVLKPTLLGGFSACDRWIKLAEKQNIGWWATSALEGNVGLSAIAQWVATKNNPLHQGLGTGALYQTNFPSRTRTEKDRMWFLQNSGTI